MSKSEHPRRRDPERAKALILGAADELLVDCRPDEVTLRSIAASAGVSHGLITHYFGSYEGVVRAVLSRRQQAAVAEVVERLANLESAEDARAVLDVILDFLMDAQRTRLRAWLEMRGQAPERDGKLAMLVVFTTAQVNRLRERERLPPLSPELVANVIQVVRAAARGYASGERSPEGDAIFRGTLLAMVQAFFARAIDGGSSTSAAPAALPPPCPPTAAASADRARARAPRPPRSR